MMMLNGLDAKFKEKGHGSKKSKQAPKDAEEDDMVGDILKKDSPSDDADKKETDELQMMGGDGKKEKESENKPSSEKAVALSQEDQSTEEPPKQENVELESEQNADV